MISTYAGTGRCRETGAVRFVINLKTGGEVMSRIWSKPVIVEVAVGMEINCYACAELA